ncbi:MAG: TetR/AcrR family transcriptional regulator [Alphaproteobacteria bacterium]
MTDAPGKARRGGRTAAAKPDPAPAADEAGRPRARDAEATRARILQAALEEFAAKGLAGARVDEIAARAGINKRMIYVYFGNKERLFLAVLEEAYADIRASERQLHLADLAPRAAIERLVAFTWDYYLRHPGFLRLINSENLHKARHIKKSQRIREIHPPFISMVREVLDRGVASGDFRPGIDPNQLYISIAALGYYYLTNQYTLSVIYNRELGAPAALAERLDAILDMVLRYVLADPRAQLG